MGDQVSKQASFLNLLKTSFCGKLEMLSEKLDNVWLIISRHTSQFFSITKVAAQDAPSLWLGFDKLCQVCVWRGAHLTCNLGRISKYKFLAEFYSKYQFRASVYNVVWYVWEWWESPNSHSHVRWSQMKWNESIAPTRLLINCGIIPNISIIESEWIPFEMLLILWENLTLALRIWG